MPRKYQSNEIYLKPDPRFDSVDLQKFINCVMERGKRSTASQLVYDALDKVKTRIPDKEPVDVFAEAVNNIRPHLEVKSRRVGGANYQVPVEVNQRRGRYLAYKWLIEAARGRKGKPFAECLALELADAFRREGTAVKKREETHRMADANRAFAHFAW